MSSMESRKSFAKKLREYHQCTPSIFSKAGQKHFEDLDIWQVLHARLEPGHKEIYPEDEHDWEDFRSSRCRKHYPPMFL